MSFPLMYDIVSCMYFSVYFQYIQDNLCVMSGGFLLSSPDDAVIMEGSKEEWYGLFVVRMYLY